jgi:hypothetical protein
MVFSGAVVEKEKYDWTLDNGKRGTSYWIYIRDALGSQRDSAQRVVITAEQFGLFADGDVVELPVAVSMKRGFDGKANTLLVELDPSFDNAGSAVSVPAYSGS